MIARNTAVPFFFVAVTNQRTYEDTLRIDEALGLVRRHTLTKLDPQLFEHFAEHAKFLKKERVAKYVLVPDFDPCHPHPNVISLIRDARALPKNEKEKPAEAQTEDDWELFQRMTEKKK